MTKATSSNPSLKLARTQATQPNNYPFTDLPALERRILDFFNDVDDMRDLAEVFRSPQGKNSRLAAQVVKIRDNLEDARFERLEELFSIPGFDSNLRSSVHKLFTETSNPVEMRTRRGDEISGNWVYERTGLTLEIIEDEDDDIVLLKLASGRYLQEFTTTIYNPVEDAFGLSVPFEKLLGLIDAPTSCTSRFTNSPLVHLDRTGQYVLELSCAGKAYPFIMEDQAVPILDPEEQAVYRNIIGDYQVEEAFFERMPVSNSINRFDDLPDWWSSKDTKDFLTLLVPHLQQQIEEKFGPNPNIPQHQLEKVVNKSALRLLVQTLTEKETERLCTLLLRTGKTSEQARRAASRIGKRIQRDYLYKRPALMRRFKALTELESLQALLTSPHKWLRGQVAHFFIEALGKRVLSFNGLIDKLFLVGHTQLCWWEIQETWEGANQIWQQSRKLEKIFEQFYRTLTPRQRKRIEPLYLHQRDCFEKLRKKHKQLIYQRSNTDPNQANAVYTQINKRDFL